jgi:uncharacterized delta-60 repeat protein
MTPLAIAARLLRQALIPCVLALFGANSTSAAPGDLDTSFGEQGRLRLTFPTAMGETLPGEVVVHADGKVALVGACAVLSGGSKPCVLRRLPDGSPDDSFGAQGFVALNNVSSDITVLAAALPAGKLIIATTCAEGGERKFCAFRLNDNGTLDASFGSAGRATAAQGTLLVGFALQRDGKLLLVGACGSELCVARVDANGILDAGFGSNGVTRFPLPSGVSSLGSNLSVSVQTDGKLLVTTACRLTPSNADLGACVFRLHANGPLDLSYGVAGMLFITVGEIFGNPPVNAAATQPDDRTIVAGACENSSGKFCLARLNVDGRLDETFGTGGTLIDSTISVYQVINAIRVQHDGRILVGGSCGPPNTSSRMCIQRYNGDGSPDTSLSLKIDLLTADASVNWLGTQPDGKLVVAGNCYAAGATLGFCLARYEGGSFGNQACSLDLDGDGAINPAIDGLMLTRIALGFTGTAVYAGISFPASARRTQWGSNDERDLRKFLITQCNMKL